MFKFVFVALLTFVSGCQINTATEKSNSTTAAPGAPGAAPVWAYSGKTGIGTSYEAYVNGQYSDLASTGTVSKVWFSIAEGIVTETMWGLIHQAQIKDLQLLMIGDDFIDSEQSDTNSQISYLHTDSLGRPLSPAYKIVNSDKDAKYSIEKHVFTDPEQQSLVVRYQITAKVPGIKPVLTVNPHINNDGSNDRAWVGTQGLFAEDSGVFLNLKSSNPFVQQSVGFVGVSDALAQAKAGDLNQSYASTGEQRGNVALSGAFKELKVGEVFSTDIVIGFGNSLKASSDAATGTLDRGYQAVLNHYNGKDAEFGWEDYLQSLTALPKMAKMATDDGKLAFTSALVLKVQEDKTHAGALIASLSNPWGDTVSAAQGATGYKAVWPRDFYQCAMALLALGDLETPKVAFEYLNKVQVSDQTPGNSGVGGWFLQKTHVDGQLEWIAVQTDQTGMPLMLAWKLWQAGVLSAQELKVWYQKMLKPAADFLVSGGTTKLDWNNREITPPWTQQERWEEQEGYSPSSTAAVIAGLISAREIALKVGDQQSAAKYLAAADEYSAAIETTMFTTKGKHNHNGQYYLRITKNTDPNDNGKLEDRNGRGELAELDVIDGGFLELVRYGVRPANDPYILDSLQELDDQNLAHPLRVKYSFSFENDKNSYPGWRRYGLDGYGEDFITGANYGASGSDGGAGGGMSPNQRGRVWPFFTGERAHYELAKGAKVSELRRTYVRALEYFANEGLMLPEQVFDGVGVNPQNRYTVGEGTNSATPLAWTHAEYLKLLRSLSDNEVWDHYPPVAERFAIRHQP